MRIESIDIGPLLLGYEQFSAGLAAARSDLEKAGAIQYFEFTYELAWKTMKRILAHRGKEANSPRIVFREAALEGLISDPTPWFGFLADRNDTIHTYSRDRAEAIFSHLPAFEREMAAFIDTLNDSQINDGAHRPSRAAP